MATSKKYDDAAEFAVKLKWPIDYRGAILLPLPVHDMTGRALNAIIEQEGEDVVDTAEPR